MKTSIIDARIAQLEVDLLLWGPAITKLALGKEFYIIDTGQSKQTVRNYQLADIKKAYQEMWSEYSDLCARRGSSTIIAAPAW